MVELLPEKLRTGTVLVVDEMSFYVSFVSQLLIRQGFKGEFLSASKLSDGFDLINNCYANEKKINLIITEVTLPDGQGISLVKKIRKNEILKSIPIIVMSNETSSKKIIEVFESGVDCFVNKPMNDEIFMSKIMLAWKKYN